MQECTKLRRVELRALARFGAQTVAQKVLEPAGGKVIDARSGEMHLPPIQRRNALARERAAHLLRRFFHGGDTLALPAAGKVFPRGGIPGAGKLQSTGERLRAGSAHVAALLAERK